MANALEAVPFPLSALSLKERVRRKREVLAEWHLSGVPHNYLETLPTSLTTARMWSIPELGIHPIGSPNSFTTSHVDVGEDVQAISDLIRRLHRKLLPPKKRGKSSRVAPTITAKEVEKAMSDLVSQWHTARDEAYHWKERAIRAEKHRDIAREAVRAKEAEISELRRRLAGGLSLVQ